MAKIVMQIGKRIRYNNETVRAYQNFDVEAKDKDMLVKLGAFEVMPEVTYEVVGEEAIEEEVVIEDKEDKIDYSTFTKAELEDVAKEQGIELDKGLNKKEIIEKLK